MTSYHPSDRLPLPDEMQIAHSAKLIERIAERVECAGGVISFHDYMHSCLYEPGLGYYTAGSLKLGKDGDFITAPEISPMFGQCLGNYAARIFADGLPACVLEVGAGSGRLCRDLVQRLNSLHHPWQTYLILEPSADLRQRQQAWLQQELEAQDFARIEWLDALPSHFDGLLIANEVLDAMPVHVVVKDGDWIELGVGFDGEKFVWQSIASSGHAIDAIRHIDADDRLPQGYCTEVNLNYEPWCRALADSCGHARMLLIDYGYEQAEYYHPARHSGTLVCFYRHRAHPDPFIYPGLQDITAFVDFDAFAAAAVQAGLQVRRFSSQAAFLLEQGLLELGAGVADQMQQLQLAQQIKTLTLPGEMGEKFKVIELGTG